MRFRDPCIKRLCYVSALVVLVAAAPVWAQTAEVFRLLGSADAVPSYEGWALDVAVRDTYAYVAQNAAGLQIFDVSDPETPVRLSVLACPEAVTNVAVSGNYVYTAWRADENGGLYTIDVADPENPVLRDTYEAGDTARGVAVGNGLACLATSSGLQILDLSDPAAPAWLATHATPEPAWKVALEGDRAYVVLQGFDAACGRSLQVIDISTPEAPVLAGACCLPDTYDADYGDYLYMFCYEIAVAPGYAYLAWGDGQTGGYFKGRFDVIDISDPAHPVRCSEYEAAPGMRGLGVDGVNAYLCLKETAVLAVDISEPCSPSAVETLQAWGAMNACATNGYMYLANGAYEDLMIYVIDSDLDGLTDYEETTQSFTDPHRADSDGDSLSDREEFVVHGTNPLDPDSDGDGVRDRAEVEWGSDPWDPASGVDLPLAPCAPLLAGLVLFGLGLSRMRRA